MQQQLHLKTADAGMNMAMILVVVIAATGAVVYARRRMTIQNKIVFDK